MIFSLKLLHKETLDLFQQAPVDGNLVQTNQCKKTTIFIPLVEFLIVQKWKTCVLCVINLDIQGGKSSLQPKCFFHFPLNWQVSTLQGPLCSKIIGFVDWVGILMNQMDKKTNHENKSRFSNSWLPKTIVLGAPNKVSMDNNLFVTECSFLDIIVFITNDGFAKRGIIKEVLAIMTYSEIRTQFPSIPRASLLLPSRSPSTWFFLKRSRMKEKVWLCCFRQNAGFLKKLTKC